MVNKVVVFDLDDTLYSKADQFYTVFQQFAQVPLSKERIWAIYTECSDLAFEQFQSGELTLADSHFKRVDEFFRQIQLPVSATQVQAFNQAYTHQLTTIALSPAWQNCLSELKAAQYPIALLTNGPSNHQRQKLHCLKMEKWIPATYWFISEELGHAKPDPLAFEAVEQAFGTQAHSFIMVGDSYRNDIKPALKRGWQAVWSWQYRTATNSSQMECLNSPTDLWQFL